MIHASRSDSKLAGQECDCHWILAGLGALSVSCSEMQFVAFNHLPGINITFVLDGPDSTGTSIRMTQGRDETTDDGRNTLLGGGR